MASLTRWTWVWVSSGSWWWTGKPGVLQSMGSKRVGHNWANELSTWLSYNLMLYLLTTFIQFRLSSSFASSNHKSDLFFCKFVFLDSIYHWDYTVLSFSVWFISLTIMSLQPVHVVTKRRMSSFFLWLNNIIHLCVYYSFFIHSCIDISIFNIGFLQYGSESESSSGTVWWHHAIQDWVLHKWLVEVKRVGQTCPDLFSHFFKK